MFSTILATALATVLTIYPSSDLMSDITSLVANETQSYASNEIPDSFVQLFRREKPILLLNCDDGYVYGYEEVYKTRYTNKADLYLVHMATFFTPGYVACQNNTKQPNGKDYKDYRLKCGYLHATLSENGYNDTISIVGM